MDLEIVSKVLCPIKFSWLAIYTYGMKIGFCQIASRCKRHQKKHQWSKGWIDVFVSTLWWINVLQKIKMPGPTCPTSHIPCHPTQWARAIKTSIWMVNRDPKWWIAYNMVPKQGHVRVRLSNIKPLPLNINQPNFATFDLVHILQKKHFGIHTSHRFSYPKKHRIVKKKSASQYGWAGHRYIQVPAENNTFFAKSYETAFVHVQNLQ